MTRGVQPKFQVMYNDGFNKMIIVIHSFFVWLRFVLFCQKVSIRVFFLVPSFLFVRKKSFNIGKKKTKIKIVMNIDCYYSGHVKMLVYIQLDRLSLIFFYLSPVYFLDRMWLSIVANKINEME